MAKGEISPRMQKMLSKGRAEARKRVIERGLIQFRADATMMQQLLEISEHRGIPLGTMLREWVKDRLRNENISRSANDKNSELYNQMQKIAEMQRTILRKLG